MRLIKEDKRILTEPAPFIGINLLGPSSVDLAVRVWVLTDDFNDIFFDMNERVYQEFEKVGLRFPFPQLDVHLKDKA